MLWDRDKDEQLDKYLNTYFSELTDNWRFYQDLDYNNLAKMLDFDDIDLIKLKADEVFDSKIFNSNYEIEPYVIESTKHLPQLTQKIQQEIDDLHLDNFIGGEEAKPEENQVETVKPVTPIPRSMEKSIPGGRRVSLDLMQSNYRPNLQIASKPALINATKVNINVEPLKFAMPIIQPPIIKTKPIKSFSFKFGKNNKTNVAKQQDNTIQQNILDQKQVIQRRRTSFMEESLPAYIKQQIGNIKPNQSVSNDEHLLSTLVRYKRNSEPAMGISSLDGRLSESIRSKSHTIKQKSPSPTKAPPITEIVQGNITMNQNSQENSNQNSPLPARQPNSTIKIHETLEDSDLIPNTNRFHNLLSNSQHLYSHTKDIRFDNQTESPTTTASEPPDTIQGYAEDEYISPHVITRYYELQNEDSQEREEFLRALDQDDDTDFINLNGNYDDNDNDNDNDSNDEYKDQERRVEDEYLF